MDDDSASRRARALTSMGLHARAREELDPLGPEHAEHAEHADPDPTPPPLDGFAFPVIHDDRAYPVRVWWSTERGPIVHAIVGIARRALAQAWADMDAASAVPPWWLHVDPAARDLGLPDGGRASYLACYLAAIDRATHAPRPRPRLWLAAGHPRDVLEHPRLAIELARELGIGPPIGLGVAHVDAQLPLKAIERPKEAAARVYGHMPWHPDAPTPTTRVGLASEAEASCDLDIRVRAPTNEAIEEAAHDIKLAARAHKRVDVVVVGAPALAAALGSELKNQAFKIRFRAPDSSAVAWVNAPAHRPPAREPEVDEGRWWVTTDARAVPGWTLLPCTGDALIADPRRAALEVAEEVSRARRVHLALDCPAPMAAAIGSMLRNLRPLALYASPSDSAPLYTRD